MEPSTKIWLVTLNEGHSMVETAFSGIWTETLMAMALHTHERCEHYVLFQCNDEPDLLAIILGNCSVDASLDAHKTTDKPLSRLTEFITHRELFHLEIDTSELPLDPRKIAISFSESEPADSDSLPGKGNWGVSTSWRRAKHNSNDPSKPEKKTWIHIASSEDADRLSQVGNIKNFSKILESHVASQTAE
ncbi:hypothetical protein F4782DRAFT_297036 [Xylaria castorea]|nr:hypothetical protein F4782DRAFT_297036 [Xylaria castorea]